MKAYIILGLFLALGTALAAPLLSVSYTVTPSSINPGGTAQVIVTVTNADPLVDIEHLYIKLSSGSAAIAVTSGTSDTGIIPALSTSSAAFAIRIPDSTRPGVYIIEAKGTYDYSSDESSVFTVSIPIIVSYRSALEISSSEMQITPGATESLQITLRNAGKSPIKDLVVSLSPSTTYIYPIGNMRNAIQILNPGESSEAMFQIRASDLATAGIQPATVTVAYTDAAGTTQTDTQSIGIIVVDAGTEVVIDSVNSTLEPGKTGTVTIGVKNVGDVKLDNLYFSLTTTGTGLDIRGSNEKLMDSLAVGETKTVEFEFDVSQDAAASPAESTLSITYERDGGKKQMTDTKPLGIVVGGAVDLRIIDKTPKSSDNQVEIDIANYGNKDADAVKVDMVASGNVVGTGFTDQIKSNKHKVFRFDMPSEKNVLIRITYKDYGSETGVETIEESVTLSAIETNTSGTNVTAIIVPVVIVVLFLVWYLRRRSKSNIKIDVSKYK